MAAPKSALTIIVDTREQKPWAPWSLEKGKRVPIAVERGTLTEGDYSVQGREHEVRIERKSLEDAVGTAFGKTELADGTKADSWDRFRRELDRVKALDLKRFWVFIEASREDVYGRKYWSGRHSPGGGVDPKCVLGRWDSIEVDHGVSVLWCGSREEAERMVGWYLRRFVEGREREEAAK